SAKDNETTCYPQTAALRSRDNLLSTKVVGTSAAGNANDLLFNVPRMYICIHSYKD
ncbi:unnamed protein product, partial [Allacma fusca]